MCNRADPHCADQACDPDDYHCRSPVGNRRAPVVLTLAALELPVGRKPVAIQSFALEKAVVNVILTLAAQMKPAIDNKPPPKYVHLAQNLKKQQMDEERYSQIERDNYLLLDKMSYIMTHPQLLDEKYMGPPVTYGKSLNKEFRKRELMRITEENLQILRRIQHKEPYYSHLDWEEQAARDEEYLKNCSEYPVVLPAATRAKGGTTNRGNRSARGSGEAPSFAVQPTPPPPHVRAHKQGSKGQTTITAQQPSEEPQEGEATVQANVVQHDRSGLQSRGSSRRDNGPAMPAVVEGEESPERLAARAAQ